MDEERRTMEEALSQANFLQPEMYKLLGFEAVYDTAGADVGAASKKFEDLQGKFNANRERVLQIGEALKSGSVKGADARALRKERRQINKVQPNLNKQLGLAQRQLGDAQTSPRRIVGFKKLDQPADPTQSKGDLFRMALDLQNETLVRALKGEEPIDATLRTAWDEKERSLRERLRRSLGPDYETSSAGIETLANFDRERSQSFAQFNQETIRAFSDMTESRATALSNLTGARLQQLLYPAGEQAKLGLALGQTASDRLALVRSQQEARGQKFDAAAAKYKADVARDNARAEAIAGIGQGVGSIGQGAAGFSSSSYARSQGSVGDYLFGTGAETTRPSSDFTGPMPADHGAIGRYLGQ